RTARLRRSIACSELVTPHASFVIVPAMPLIDLPLAELRKYSGRNPRPADFDAYWDSALRELDATDPKPDLRPNPTVSARGIECFDLWFTGVGGARVYAKYLRPKNSN